jgi:peptidoglycan/xylan/chitin deacetylase (PgdA/CDA1 family)
MRFRLVSHGFGIIFLVAYSELMRNQVITKCNAPGQLALAYDDGPYQYTQKLVDTLTAGGARGTFFVTGEKANLHVCSTK